MNKKSKIVIKGHEITVIGKGADDYISLTDMVKGFGDDTMIYSWMRNRNTLEFIGIWEEMNNPDFKGNEFVTFRSQAGLNNFNLTPRKWIVTTNAIGFVSKAGRYGGGTFAHKDIAFEFGSWLSPEFKLYLIKEFQRLKEIESDKLQIEWDVKRLLSKTNYHLQTDAIQKHIIPQKNYSKDKQWLAYAEEADLLNVALFGCTAKDWREANSELAQKNFNIRDTASINQLTVLSNIESMNAVMIKQGIAKEERYNQLCEIANYQLDVLDTKETIKSIMQTKKLQQGTR
jgi:hypothetical protein